MKRNFGRGFARDQCLTLYSFWPLIYRTFNTARVFRYRLSFGEPKVVSTVFNASMASGFDIEWSRSFLH